VCSSDLAAARAQDGLMVDLVKTLFRQLVCPHQNRVLEMIVREPLTYTRRAQYFCPDCKRNWASAQMPEGI